MAKKTAKDMTAPIVWEPGMTLVAHQPYIVGGLTLYLEYLKGDLRTGVSPDGTRWETPVPAHYGHILDTRGGDGEELDIYLNGDDCDWAGDVHIIDQVNLPTAAWDEHKIMLGFPSVQKAEDIYIAAFSDEKGQDRLGATASLTADTFLLWVYSGDTETAISTQDIPGMVVRSTERGNLIVGDPVIRPQIAAVPSRSGAVALALKPTPTISMINLSEGNVLHYGIYIFGPIIAMITDRAIANDIVRLLNTAPSQARFDFYIASPGGSIVEAARLTSAMRNSKAKIITHAVGVVASAAVSIWAEGDERYIGDYAFFMQHMSSHLDMGKSTNVMRRSAAIIQYVRNVILQKQIDVGLWTEQEVADLLATDRDLYLTADEARSRVGK